MRRFNISDAGSDDYGPPSPLIGGNGFREMKDAASGSADASPRAGEVKIRISGASRGSALWDAARYTDVFVHIFEFSTLADRARAAAVCRSWRRAAYDPSLWKRLDLSPYARVVGDRFSERVLSTARFRSLEALSLRGCRAMSDRTLKVVARIPGLRDLDIAGCDRVSAGAVLHAAAELKALERMDVLGAGAPETTYLAEAAAARAQLVPELLRLRPGLDVGPAWLVHCARAGVAGRPGAVVAAKCRWEGRPGSVRRGCWGAVSGQVLYSNQQPSRARPGGRDTMQNVPCEVLFSCQAHTAEDARDADVYTCMVCGRYFRRPSMCIDHGVCKPCRDNEVVRGPEAWLDLTDPDVIPALDLAMIARKTKELADRKNAPETLRVYGSRSVELAVPGRADEGRERRLGEVRVAEAEELERQDAQDAKRAAVDGQNDDEIGFRAAWSDSDEDDDDSDDDDDAADASLALGGSDAKRAAGPTRRGVPSLIPPRAAQSADAKEPRVTPAEQLGHVRRLLSDAKESGEERAALLFDRDRRVVEVVADRQPIVKGVGQGRLLDVAQRAWRYFPLILYPFVATVLICTYFTVAFRAQAEKYAPESRHAQNDQLSENKSDNQDITQVLIIAAVFFAVFLCIVYLIYRHRAFCERQFRRFLVLDILFIFILGIYSMVAAAVLRLAAPIDWVTITACIWNVSCAGLAALYLRVSDGYRRVFLTVLNIVMATMLAVVIPPLLLVIFIGLVAIVDMVSVVYPQYRAFGPFLQQTNEFTPMDTPMIFYELPGLRFRFGNLFTFGLLVGCVPIGTAVQTATVLAMIVSIVIGVYVLPYFQKEVRPVSLALGAIVLLVYLDPGVVRPYARSIDFLYPFSGVSAKVSSL